MSKKDENFKYGRKDMLEYVEYIDQLTPEHQKWIKDFYLENYAQSGYFKDRDLRIITTEEGLSEANRNHNMLKTEAMELNRTEPGKLKYSVDQRADVLNEISDEQDWKMYFSLEGPELALQEIIQQALTDLDNEKIDRKVTLARFHSKMVELGRMIRAEKKLEKQIEELKTKPKTKKGNK